MSVLPSEYVSVQVLDSLSPQCLNPDNIDQNDYLQEG